MATTYCFAIDLKVYGAYVSRKFDSMKIFRASTHVDGGSVSLRLDNAVINDGVGFCEIPLSKGEHVVEWFVEGAAHGCYGITISSPVAAEFQLSKRLDASGRDFGGFKFTT
jgi:hypothetical protein